MIHMLMFSSFLIVKASSIQQYVKLYVSGKAKAKLIPGDYSVLIAWKKVGAQKNMAILYIIIFIHC